MSSTLRFVVVIAIAACGMPSFAFDASVPAANHCYLELLGSGLNISFQYERTLGDGYTASAGLGGYGFNDNSVASGFTWVPVVPVAVHRWFGEGSTTWEVGAGAIVHLTSYGWETMFPSLSNARIKGTVSLGVRYQAPWSNIIAGARLTPVFDATGVAPWAGVYVGWGF